MKSPKPNWFASLNQALESEGLLDIWPIGSSIPYGQTVRHIVEHDGVTRLISITRETDGTYERPVHYTTQVDKVERDVYRDAARYRWLRTMEGQAELHNGGYTGPFSVMGKALDKLIDKFIGN